MHTPPPSPPPMFSYLKHLQAIDHPIITTTKPLRNKIGEPFCDGL